MRLIDADLMFKCETCRYCRNGKCSTYCDHGEEYSPDMSKLPTIDPEELRPKGRWIEIDDNYGDSHWQCSACKVEWYFEVGDPAENGSHYCPNCGAKMEVNNGE